VIRICLEAALPFGPLLVFGAYGGRKVELRHVPRVDPPEPEVLGWLR
jgi:hypothetical protein